MKQNLLFILVDCLRADKCYGEDRTSRTPNIDAIIKKGTFFSKSIVTAPCTIPSVPSIFTGLYPLSHGIWSMSCYKLADGVKTMAQFFKENGYNTYAFVTGPLLSVTGLDRGFDSYSYRLRKEYFVKDWGERIISKFRNQEFQQPWFIFLHLWELHEPRCIAKGFNKKRYGKNKYERTISGLDARLGQLFQYIDFNTTAVIFTSDHGEKIRQTMLGDYLYDLRRNFHKILVMPTTIFAGIVRKIYKLFKMEYDRLPNFARHSPRRNKPVINSEIGHGFNLYDYSITTPLVIVGNNKIFPEAKFISAQIRQIDILPTLMESFNLNHVNKNVSFDGQSLIPLIKGKNTEENFAYCDILSSFKNYRKAGIRTSKYKFIHSLYNSQISEELYDLEKDPQEKQNIKESKPEIANFLREELFKIKDKKLAGVKLVGNKMTMDEEKIMTERLRNLGYLE